MRAGEGFGFLCEPGRFIEGDQGRIRQVIEERAQSQSFGPLLKHALFRPGQDPDAVGAANAALGLGFKTANRLDFVAEELDPQRKLAGDGEDVENAAPETHLPPALDHQFPLVAELDEFQQQGVDGLLVAHAQRQALFLETGAPRHPLQQRLHRRHARHRRALFQRFRQPHQHVHALGHDVVGRFHGVRRQDFPGGKQEALFFRQETAEVFVDGVGVGAARGRNQQRDPARPRQLHREEGLARTPWPDDLHAPAGPVAQSARRVFNRL